MLRIEALEIDDKILDKLETKHGVTLEEVEEACYCARRHVRRGRDGRYKVFSQADAGRYLFIVLVPSSEGVWRIVTARDMVDRERELYQEHRGEA
ncbi:MAG: BrnT family toxin [Armatimonadetes bacterium]|nr:BrnT family toxin [Armatimonadota bacterium]